MICKRLVFLLLFFVSLSTLQAQERPYRTDDRWNWHSWYAQWIAPPDIDPYAYGVYHLRKSFGLSSVPASLPVYVSGDNRYRLYVNGHYVGFGPARDDAFHWPYDSLDLAPHLQRGKNVIAVELVNFGPDRPVAQHSVQTGFILQAADTAYHTTINTGTPGWKTLQNEAYQPIPITTPALHAYVAIGVADSVAGARYPWGWQRPDFDDAAWADARRIQQGIGPGFVTDAKWLLVPRAIPPLEETPMRLPRVERTEGLTVAPAFLAGNQPITIPPNTQASLLLDNEVLTVGYPELRVSGGQGSRVRVTYAEALFDDRLQKGNRDATEGRKIFGYHDSFLPDGGPDRLFKPLWVRTFRYVQLDITTGNAPLTLQDYYNVFTAYPLEERARFASDDASLDAIWSVGWRTARLCAGETYFDCPYYEQLQYVGDTRIQALISLYVAGDARLMRQALLQLDHSRIPEGITQSRYPSHLRQLIPPFSLFWIAMIHDYHRHRNDSDLVRSLLPGIRTVLDWYGRRVDRTGMLGPLPWWNFADWAFPHGIPPGVDEGGSALISLQYLYALQYAAGIMADFGLAEEAERYGREAINLKNTIYRRCYSNNRGLLADTPEHEAYSQHTNAMGVLTNVIPLEDQPRVMRRLLEDAELTQTTFYYRFYLMQALYKAGLGDLYVEQLAPWRAMLELGLTTFAEQPDPTRSDCHAWSASPNFDLLATVCGIRSTSPGFRTVRIAPALGPLRQVEGVVPHPQGEVAVQFQKDAQGRLTGTVSLPEGVTGVLVWNGEEKKLKGGEQKVSMK
ncbi:alpha-L-rhamnosidase [Catalinimonas alkaloidigena]|uniref:Alpha-L-rhamnosidase n=1 Tax=Catalinimonas alkaloidigena TaxID=1075417 RepID=A0A1G9GBU7_9BACT|nr:alpha-L-rhamnosidase C-terminal domain-containing protein [Catalinimonas alkaloidigena]SDK98045.1 alpha-L-rhamnosidase [Catalinimonas alkaloidigena]